MNQAERRARMSPESPWGCWSCGSPDSRVRDTGTDEDGCKVRLRMCTDCGERWETEEKRIAAGSFFGRAANRHRTDRNKKRSVTAVCRVCRGPFRYSTYSAHKETALHQAVVAQTRERQEAIAKKYQREWTRIDRANRRTIRKMEQERGIVIERKTPAQLAKQEAANVHRSGQNATVRASGDHARYVDSRLTTVAERGMLSSGEEIRGE